MTYEESKYRDNIVLDQSVKPGGQLNGDDAMDLVVSGTNPISHLPSMFQNYDRRNGDFLKRYLWIFHDILNSVTHKLDYIHNYFNPLETPSKFFGWLASWFSLSLDYAITEDTMRLLVKEAVNLYQWRGTALGLAKFLEIITGVKPDIIEHSVPINEYIISDDKLIERPILEENYSIYNFTVSFPVTSEFFDVDTIKKINMVIKSEKPAHSNYYIIFAPPEVDDEKDYALIGVDVIA